MSTPEQKCIGGPEQKCIRRSRRKAALGRPSGVRRSGLGCLARLSVVGDAPRSTLALFEPVAVAVHLEDMDVMGEPVEQCAGEPLGGEHAGPLVERQIALTMVEPRS